MNCFRNFHGGLLRLYGIQVRTLSLTYKTPSTLSSKRLGFAQFAVPLYSCGDDKDERFKEGTALLTNPHGFLNEKEKGMIIERITCFIFKCKE